MPPSARWNDPERLTKLHAECLNPAVGSGLDAEWFH